MKGGNIRKVKFHRQHYTVTATAKAVREYP